MKEYLKGSLVIEGIFKIYESNGSLQNKICRKYLRYKPFLKSAPLQKFQNFLGSFIFNYVYFHFMSKNMFWGREWEIFWENQSSREGGQPTIYTNLTTCTNYQLQQFDQTHFLKNIKSSEQTTHCLRMLHTKLLIYRTH